MMDDLFLDSLQSLLAGEPDPIASYANAAAYLYMQLDKINWAGFYFVQDNELVLGPFCGKPACSRIAYGKGVCGTAWKDQATQLVPDVHQFPGHIACDADSRSEIVIPLFQNGSVKAVMDIDSPITGRFTESDRALLEKAASVIQNHLYTKAAAR